MQTESKPFPPGSGVRFFLIYCALFAPFSLITPYFQQLLGYLGYGPAQIGYILGALELMAVLAPMFWGILADRLGMPRGVLLLTVLMSMPAFLLFRWTGGTVGAVLAALLFGLFYKPCIPLTDGMTFRYIKEHGGDYGRVRTGGTTGYLVCIGLFDLCFLLAGGVSANGILLGFCAVVGIQLLSLLLLPETASGSGATGVRFSVAGLVSGGYLRPVFLLVILVAFMGRVSMMSYYSFFSRYLSERYGLERVGLIWGLGSICEIPLVFYSHRIMARIGVKGLLLLGLGGIVVRLAGFGLELGFWFVLLLQPLHMLTFGA